MAKPELGQIIGGKYRLLRELGRGGMATVFEAENTLTLKRAAVKWLHPQFHDEQRGMQRVIREARASSRIRHDNVVDVYDVAEEASSVYLVMELLRGELLSTVLEREELPMHELVSLLVPVMRGVAAAHAAGVIHRDIKPDNIFLAREPGYERAVPKVIDFGISKVPDSDPSNATRSGITMGTPRYVSYEQLLGARDVDVRTDVYSFGVILYESLTGQLPYGEAITFGEQAVRFATREPRPVRAFRPEVPPVLDVLVQRAIAKRRDERTESMEELVLALVPFADPALYEHPLTTLRLRASRSFTGLTGEGRAITTRGPRARDQGEGSTVEEMLDDSSPARPSIPVPSRRRGMLLGVIGVAAMGIAMLSIPFEEHTRAPVQAKPLAAAAVMASAEPEVRPEPTPAEEALPLPALEAPIAPAPEPDLAPLKRTRRGKAKPEPEVAAAAPAVSASTPSEEDSRHRAGKLLRTEF